MHYAVARHPGRKWSYLGTYWELVNWDDQRNAKAWTPAPTAGYEIRDVTVVYLNQFRRRGWGTGAPWCWFSNSDCYTYEVAAWRELKPGGASDSSAARDESNSMHAFYTRDRFLPLFANDPLKYLSESRDTEAADAPKAEGPEVHAAREFVSGGRPRLVRG